MTGSLEAVSKALKLAHAVEETVRANEAQERDLRIQGDAKEAQAQAQDEAGAAEEARKVRAGKAPSLGAPRGLKAARLAQASKAAAEEVAAERPALLTHAAEARGAVTNAVLDFTVVERDAGLGAFQAALRTAGVEPLSRMIAAELVRTALIGDRYGFDAEAHPPATLWSGAYAARAFLAAIPARLTPPGFMAEVEEAAAALARETLARIGG